jgi:hypothetical protein
MNGINRIQVVRFSREMTTYENRGVIVTNCEEAQSATDLGCRFLLVSKSLSCPQSLTSTVYAFQVDSGVLWEVEGKLVSIFPMPGSNRREPSIADFSSKGPSVLGPIKPEIVAPGSRVYSAGAHVDTVTVMSGTSMATPVVSGTLLLLRQYLSEKRQIPNPSSALMKALVIASGEKKDPIFPDLEMGFGALDVSNIIPELSGVDLQLEDRIQVPTNQEVVYQFTAKSPQKELRIAMAYTDAALGVDSMRSLYIDLDLFVVRNRDQKIFHPLPSGEDLYSTCERVVIKVTEFNDGDVFTVHIRSTAFDYAADVKTCALVICGPCTGFVALKEISPWNGLCGNDGKVNGSSCVCSEGTWGLFCQHREAFLAEESRYGFQSLETRSFVFNIRNMQHNFTIFIEDTRQDPFYLLHASLSRETKPIFAKYTTDDTKQRFSWIGTRSEFSENFDLFISVSNMGPSYSEPIIGGFIDQDLDRIHPTKTVLSKRKKARLAVIVTASICGGVLVIGAVIVAITLYRNRSERGSAPIKSALGPDDSTIGEGNNREGTESGNGYVP